MAPLTPAALGGRLLGTASGAGLTGRIRGTSAGCAVDLPVFSEKRLLGTHRGLQTMVADAGQAQVGPDVCIHGMPVTHGIAAEGAEVLGGLVPGDRKAAKDVWSEERGEDSGKFVKIQQILALLAACRTRG